MASIQQKTKTDTTEQNRRKHNERKKKTVTWLFFLHRKYNFEQLIHNLILENILIVSSHTHFKILSK